MSLSSINFDDISERDLLDQIQAGVPEGVLIDYKQNLYGRTDADVKEFLKDVSSFGNTAGGHLIIGVHETAGVPTGISALSGDPDLQRLENLARDGIEPRIAGLRMMCRSPPAALFWFCASRGVESMHWLLDVEFGDDLSRYRTG